MQPSFARYLLLLGLSLLTLFGAVWLYVAAAPMAFMEPGYAAWVAKSAMLDQCRLGEIAFFGDSRLEAGVVPAALPAPASNFGLAAGTAVEAHSAVRRALACPSPPRQAVLALVPKHFGPLSRFFWILSLRYGFISPGELAAIERLAGQLGDRESLATPTPDGLHGPLRDWLYALRFPSFSFASLLGARVFGRYASNRAHYDAVLEARGWAPYIGGEPQREPDDAFGPTKLETAEFEAAIAALQRRGVEVFLMVTPFSEKGAGNPESHRRYLDYLAGLRRRFPGLQLLAPGVPVWPDRLFADGAHLDPAGAKLFSARLAACMPDGKLRPACDLEWRPATASAGSAILQVEQQGDRQH